MKECQGVVRVYFVSETAQVVLRSGRVQAPAVEPLPHGIRVRGSVECALGDDLHGAL